MEVKFAVLLPQSDGIPTQKIPFDEVIEMVEETKDVIQNNLGSTIESVSHSPVKDGKKVQYLSWNIHSASLFQGTNAASKLKTNTPEHQSGVASTTRMRITILPSLWQPLKAVWAFLGRIFIGKPRYQEGAFDLHFRNVVKRVGNWKTVLPCVGRWITREIGV